MKYRSAGNLVASKNQIQLVILKFGDLGDQKV